MAIALTRPEVTLVDPAPVGLGPIKVHVAESIAAAALAFGPAAAVRPQTIDAVGWSAFIGVISAWTFTALDIIILRPVGLYSWRWDAIGGCSGWWYIPVWWMASAFLAWLGGWSYAARAHRGAAVQLSNLAGLTAGVALIVTGLLALLHVVPFNAAGMALGLGVSVVAAVPISAAMNSR